MKPKRKPISPSVRMPAAKREMMPQAYQKQSFLQKVANLWRGRTVR